MQCNEKFIHVMNQCSVISWFKCKHDPMECTHFGLVLIMSTQITQNIICMANDIL